MKLENTNETPLYLKALIYGPFGIGKTMLAGTACDVEAMRGVLLVRAEDGALTIKNNAVRATPLIDTIKLADEVYFGLAQRSPEFAGIKTVVFDSISAMLQTVLREVVDTNCRKNSNKDPNLPSQHDYGQMTFIMRRMIRRFAALPMNVIFTALLRERFNTDDEAEKMKRGPVLCMPDLTPKVAEDAMAAVDMVWALNAKADGTRVLLTQRSGAWVAKTRGEEFAKALAPKLENPTLPIIHKLLTETQGKQV